MSQQLSYASTKSKRSFETPQRLESTVATILGVHSKVIAQAGEQGIDLLWFGAMVVRRPRDNVR